MSEPDLSLAQFQRDLNLNYYCNLAAFTLLYYEYIITFEAEVSRIWAQSRLNTSTVIFFLNRYVTLFGHIPVVIQYFWTTSDTDLKGKICHILESYYHPYYAVLVQVMVAVMLIIRTYALYGHSKKVLAGMVLLTLGVLIHGGWAVWTAKSDEEHHDDKIPYVGCATSVGAALGRRLAAGWIGMLIFDNMIFLLTLFRGLSIGWAEGTFLRLFVRDGSLYYAVMIACNLANILTFYLGSRIVRGLLTTFTNVVSSILISRLMLNLRDPKMRDGATNSEITSRMVFAHRSHGSTNQTQSSASRSRTTVSTSRFTYDGDEHDTRTHLGLREVEDRIVEESVREEAIELRDLSSRKTGQGHV